MDITPLFKACIKTVKARNKAIGIQSSTSDAKRILKTKQKNGFVITAKNITAQITKLRNFLMEHRDGYLSFFNSIGGQTMTDEERDQIDVAAQRSINSCTNLIKEFRNDNRKHTASAQTMEFMKAVTEFLEVYLKSVCKIYTEIKTLRIRKALDVRKLSKLEMAKPAAVPQPIQLMPEVAKEKVEETTDSWLQRQESESEVAVIDDELSREELQMFESENVQLLNELNTMTEEVQQIESKVMHIAELQEIFSEKVLQQEQDIDRIANTVVGATENVKDANDQIKQAIQRNAGLRVYVLFFLLVMSFTLLFLDWYND